MSDILNNSGLVIATYSTYEKAQRIADELRAATGENYTVKKIV